MQHFVSLNAVPWLADSASDGWATLYQTPWSSCRQLQLPGAEGQNAGAWVYSIAYLALTCSCHTHTHSPCKPCMCSALLQPDQHVRHSVPSRARGFGRCSTAPSCCAGPASHSQSGTSNARSRAAVPLPRTASGLPALGLQTTHQHLASTWTVMQCSSLCKAMLSAHVLAPEEDSTRWDWTGVHADSKDRIASLRSA